MTEKGEVLGVVYMRPGHNPVYFQVPVVIAIKKMSKAIKFAEKNGFCFVEEKAQHALKALLDIKKIKESWYE